jgi:AraC-like DNA-binding protein
VKDGVRGAWLQSVVRDCQIFGGFALPQREYPLAQLFSEWLSRVADPQSHVEVVMLRGMLLDLTLRWGEAEHRAHRGRVPSDDCQFVPSEIAAEAWRDRRMPPKKAFERWAELYLRGLGGADPSFQVTELRRHLNFNFSRPSLIKDFAAQYSASPRRLQQDFRRLTGCTIQDYVTKKRLGVAINLLQNTDEKVEWIASEVGWASRKNLNRALTRHGRKSPAEERRTHVERRSEANGHPGSVANEVSGRRRQRRANQPHPAGANTTK